MNGELLTPDQISAGMLRLTNHWSTQPLPDSVKETWEHMLATLRKGEFMPALASWLESPRSRFRPDVGEFMEIVNLHRAEARHENDFALTADELQSRRSQGWANPDHVAHVLAQARAALGPTRKSPANRKFSYSRSK